MSKTAIIIVLLIALILTGIGQCLEIDISLEGQPSTGFVELLRGD